MKRTRNSRSSASTGSAKLALTVSAGLVLGLVIWFIASRDGAEPQSDGTDESVVVADPASADPSKLDELPGARDDYYAVVLAADYDRRDPNSDGWPTEALHDAAQEKLHELGDFVAAGQPMDENSAKRFSSAMARYTPLVPGDLEDVALDGGLTMRRATDALKDVEATFIGRSGLAEVVSEWMASFGEQATIRVRFEIVRVEIGASFDTSSVRVEAHATTPKGPVQENARWTVKWGHMPDGGEIRVTGIRVEEFERIRSEEGRPFFEDCTDFVLGGNASFAEQLLPGLDHWRARIAQRHGINVHGHEGLALGDVDGDGLDDVYVLQPGGLPNRLFLHQPDGSARDVSREAGVDFLDATRSALFVDLDNDGDQDLVVAGATGVLFVENIDGARFGVKAAIELPNAYSLAAADYDLDADLDVYVTGYRVPEAGNRPPLPYHDANNGDPERALAE